MAINVSINQIYAEKKVRGEPVFASDLHMPDQATMKILFAGHPHAIIRSIDTSKAEQLPGVLAVLTARDVPVNEFGYITKDQPVLCGPGSGKPHADRTRYVGDKVALVIAETREIAAQALDLITVDYDPLPVIDDPFESMKPETILIHPDRGTNIITHRILRNGDMASGFARADVIVESEYRTPAQEHVFLETEGGTAYVDDDGVITVITMGQWVHFDRAQICHALDLPEDRVRVIYPPAIGGAFGGREDESVQITLALAAWRLAQRGIRRPVQVSLTRHESTCSHGKRHPFHIRTRWGATRLGKLTAAEIEMVGDGGAYAFTSTLVAGNALVNSAGPYVIPNVKVDVYAVYTNNIPKAAFRGFGGPQGAFVAEMQMDKLAEKLGMDPVEFRYRNLAREGDLQTSGAPFPPGCSIVQVVEQCALAGGWTHGETGWRLNQTQKSAGSSIEAHIRRGTGFACAHKNVGFSFGKPDTCGMTIELRGESEIEKALIYQSAADVGQGIHTVITQMAAEALNLPVEKIQLIAADTGKCLDAGSVSASRMTFLAGNAIRETAALALEKWRSEERPAVVSHTYTAPATTPQDPQTGQSDPNISYGYTAVAVEVEVDMETGQIHIPRLVCAEDVGKAVNPRIVEGQIEGGVIQGFGYSVLENFIENGGQVQTPDLTTYLIPTVQDIPDQIDSLVLETADPRGPWGARGVGEVPVMAVAPAIVDAVHSATGVWFDCFPLTPERVLKGIRGG